MRLNTSMEEFAWIVDSDPSLPCVIAFSIVTISSPSTSPTITRDGFIRSDRRTNSAIVISPKFKKNFLYGASDPEQVLPTDLPGFSDGPRPIGPPDLLSTFVSAFGIDPRKYLRDGEVVKDLLA